MQMEYERLHEIENLHLLDRLIREGHDPNAYDSYGLTPLHYCENPSVADYLISRGANILKESLTGITPLDTCNQNVRMFLLTCLQKQIPVD